MPHGLGLRAKLLLGFLFAAVIVVVLAIVVVRGNRNLTANARVMWEYHELTMRYHVPRATALAEMQRQLGRMELHLNQVFWGRERQAESDLKDAAVAVLLELREYEQMISAAAAFAPNLNVVAETAWLNQFKRDFRELLAAVEPGLRQVQAGNQGLALDQFRGVLAPALASLLQSLTLAKSQGFDQQQRARDRVARLLSEAEMAIAEVNRATGIALASAMCAAVAFAWFYAGRVTTPIRRLEQSAAAIGRGDFSQQVSVRGDDEIARLAEAFNRMAVDLRAYTTLKELDRLKAEFVAAVSHELRTPITSIQGSLKLLQAGAAGEMPQQANDMLAIAARNSERLLRLVNDLLDLQKLEAGMLQLQRQRLDAVAAAAQAIANLEGFAAQANVRIQLLGDAGPLWLEADPERLQQILANLLSNACKYAGPDRQVRLRCQQSGDQVTWAVEDSGAGVPEAFRPQLFQKFTQAAGAAAGTGLGLNIAKQLAEAHGGRLEYQALAPTGSRFTLSMPGLN